MSYQVLALKYRPQVFEEVKGQEHVTTTLANAISSDRVAHALLFTGPRGTGKTTIARILAKAMACTRGPSPIPCNVCKICKDITSGHCSDVFEIDGASNNSVDQIRDLRENVTYMPASARVKIYIIDEVHMLSTAAFNALLKTLEEPPSHVIFIFATTEVHKIPATILSRCQRHDLSRVPVEEISDHLSALCEKEGYALSKESLDLIALEADGSIRDSLSLLDRVLSASLDKTIDHETVRNHLGVLDRNRMSALSDAVFRRDGAALMEIIHQVSDAGHDLKRFYADLILHFRNLNVIKICGMDSPGLNLTLGEKQTLGQTVSKVPQSHLSLLLQMLLDHESLVKLSSHTQTAVEMVLLKMIQLSPGIHLDEIITKLDALASQIDTCISKEAPPAQAKGPDPGQVPLSDPGPTPGRIPVPEPVHQPPAKPDPAGARGAEPLAGPVPQSGWQTFLARVQETLPIIFGLLSRARVTERPDCIRVEIKTRSEFEKTRMKTKDKDLQQLAGQYLDRPLDIQIRSDHQKTADDLASRQAEEKARQEATMHPLVQETMRIFDGEIIPQ